MPEIHGNLDGIRKITLAEIKALYDEQIPAGSFIPFEMLQRLCGFSSAANREIALYISRYGDIADIIIGQSDRIDLPDLRLRRSAARLSMVRCVHTHPRRRRGTQRRGHQRAVVHPHGRDVRRRREPERQPYHRAMRFSQPRRAGRYNAYRSTPCKIIAGYGVAFAD